MQIKVIKRKNKLSTFLILTLSFMPIFSELLSTFPDILIPRSLSVDSENIYIVQNHSVFIYSLKDFKLKKTLGKKGEGPGEFRFKPNVNVLKNGFILRSLSKFIHYSKSGSIIREKTFSSMGTLANVFFIKGSYIIQYNGISENFEYTKSISIFGKDLKQRKLLRQLKYRRKDITTIPMIRPRFGFKIYKNKIITVNTNNGLVFTIFDSRGIKVDEISIKYKKVPIDEIFKKNYLKIFLSTYSKDQIKIIKKKLNLTFPKYFPPLIDFYVDNDSVFIKTYEKKEEQDKYLVISIDGEYNKSILLPESKNGLANIYNSKYFYLHENEDLEEWELHVADL